MAARRGAECRTSPTAGGQDDRFRVRSGGTAGEPRARVDGDGVPARIGPRGRHAAAGRDRAHAESLGSRRAQHLGLRLERLLRNPDRRSRRPRQRLRPSRPRSRPPSPRRLGPGRRIGDAGDQAAPARRGDRACGASIRRGHTSESPATTGRCARGCGSSRGPGAVGSGARREGSRRRRRGSRPVAEARSRRAGGQATVRPSGSLAAPERRGEQPAGRGCRRSPRPRPRRGSATTGARPRSSTSPTAATRGRCDSRTRSRMRTGTSAWRPYGHGSRDYGA